MKRILSAGDAGTITHPQTRPCNCSCNSWHNSEPTNCNGRYSIALLQFLLKTTQPLKLQKPIGCASLTFANACIGQDQRSRGPLPFMDSMQVINPSRSKEGDPYLQHAWINRLMCSTDKNKHIDVMLQFRTHIHSVHGFLATFLCV